MKNVYQAVGCTIEYTAGATIASGDGVLVGGILGVAVNSMVSGDVGTLAVEGVYSLPKATGAISQGAKVYWDNSAKNVTTTSGGNTACGFAWVAAQSGDATAYIKLAHL